MKKIIFFLLILSSCAKKKDDIVIPDNTSINKPLLIGVWKYSGRTVSPAFDWDGNGTSETDIYPVMSSCQKAFYVQFTETGGSCQLSCTFSPKSITWELQDHGNEIHYVLSNGGNMTEKIFSLNNTTLITQSDVELQMGVIYKMTNTYTKQ